MQSLRSLLVSARNNLVDRKDTSPLLAFHRDERRLKPAADADPARSLWSRLCFAWCSPLLLAPTIVAVASMPLRAQELVVISGEYGVTATLQHLNCDVTGVSPVLYSALLAAIPPTQRIRGITPIDGDSTSATEVIVYTEQNNGTSHLWKVNHVAGTATIRISPLLWDEQSQGTRPENQVGIARTELGTPGIGLLNLPAWHASIGQSGTLYGPLLDGSDSGLPGATSCGASGSLPFPGPYVGGAAYDNHLLVVSGDAVIRLRKVSLPCAQQSLLTPPTAPVEVQSWTIPVNGQVLGWTLSNNGYFYAIVNRVNVAYGLSSGYTELVRSTESVDTAVGALTLTSIGGHIQDWDNGDGGQVSFPPACLAFTKQ